RQERDPVLKRATEALTDAVQSGNTFSDSLAQHPKIFNELYISMVKAGELGGVLEVVLGRLAEFQEKAQKIKGKVLSAMIYSAISFARPRFRVLRAPSAPLSRAAFPFCRR